MDRNLRKSGLSLTVAGMAGVLFFIITDPRLGIGRAAPNAAMLFNHDIRDRYYQLIDSANRAMIGTSVGIVGSVLFVLIGLYMATRHT